jgi:protein-tyrosine phosphatase
MIDIHAHLLPGVDDGARDLREAVTMCRLAAADGCTALVATPHQRTPSWPNGDLARLRALHDELQAAVGGEPRVLLGGEVRVDAELASAVAALPDAEVLPLAGSRYLLLELDRSGSIDDPWPLVEELARTGWRPILAHPEFFPWLLRDLGLLRELVAGGATVQITAMSVTGDFGRAAEEATHGLIDAGLVHFVASDCHSVAWRPPGLRRARQTIAERWGEGVADRLTRRNPQAVVEDRPLGDAPPPPAG